MRAVPRVLILLLASCASPLPAFRSPVYVGLEPTESVTTQAQLLANLAAAPELRVVDLTDARNRWAFEALSATKLRLSTRLESGGLCLTARYSVWADGRFLYSSGLYSSGLVIPRTEIGGPRNSCIALLASGLAGDLRLQGL
jgi:hypothetical protein